MAREGMVCVVPNTPGEELGSYFKTRNADDIVDGIGRVLAIQADRLEDARLHEQESQHVNPETTRIAKVLMDGGIQLAKMLDPKYADPKKPALPVLEGQVIEEVDRALLAEAFAAIESRGIPYENITEAMVYREVERIKAHKAIGSA